MDFWELQASLVYTMSDKAIGMNLPLKQERKKEQRNKEKKAKPHQEDNLDKSSSFKKTGTQIIKGILKNQYKENKQPI